MRILMATSEMAPLARTGGLADVLEAFPARLLKRGHDVSVVLPFYRCIRENRAVKTRKTRVKITVQVGSKRVDSEIYETKTPEGVQVFLIERDEYFDRSGIYAADGRTYEDNAERFIFFSKAVVELARHLKPGPDILHVHDWQTALVPAFVKDRALPFKTLLTIHNLAYQGSFWGVDFGLTNLPGQFFSDRGVEFYGQLNCLKAGIVFADAITTVSERYAREIQTAEYGCGLDGVLRENSARLTGIINGADYSLWNPATDKLIAKRYSPDAMAGKKTCRTKLLGSLGLKAKPRGPVVSMVTRLAEQKGLDILLPVLDRLLADDVRLIVLGEGETRYERELLLAQKKYPDSFAFRRAWDEPLAHLITAGSDITLIPSHHEPCGLSAMHALKYGTIPVARACGGLSQILKDYDPGEGVGNALVFYDYSPEALWDTIVRAKKMFADTAAWDALVQEAMRSDFSWERAAAEYERLYAWLSPKVEEEKPVAR
jgi:starch synthase